MNTSLTQINRLIAVLPEHDQQQLEKDLVLVSLPLSKELYFPDALIDAVYLPLDCVVSVLVGGGGTARIEIATIGNEGLAGVYAMLAPGRAIGDHIVRVPGDALRLETRRFNEYTEQNPQFAGLMQRYMFALTHQIVQSGACSQLHSMEERCARRLLMTHDRAGSDTFHITQEALAGMMGVRRATVNLAIGALKTAGFIRYVRGQVTVIDREGLEESACPCYRLIRNEYSALRLLG